MKKLIIFMTLMLMATMLVTMPGSAFAATSVGDGAALKAAVETGESVTLTGDITLGESLKISGKTLTIDLGGYTLTMPKGDNFFEAGSDITIKNGVIDISGGQASGDAYINVGNYSNSATLTLDKVTFKGDGYSSAYAVFYVRQNSTMNITNSTLELQNEKASSGGVFKGKFPHSINITSGSVLNLTDAKIGILGGNVLIQDSELNIKGGTNGINSAAGDNELHLIVDNSSVSLKDGVGGSGMKLRGGSSITVKNGSSVEITGYTDSGENDLVFDATGTMSIDDSSYVAYNTLSASADVLESVTDSDIINHTEETIAQHVLAVGFTITYTDGVDGETIFADEVYSTHGGASTPAFVGKTERDGYTFEGWSPAVVETVSGNVTYIAQWTENSIADEPISQPTDVPTTEPTVEPTVAPTTAPTAPPSNPVTGDETPIAMLMTLVVLAGVGLLVFGKKAARNN